MHLSTPVTVASMASVAAAAGPRFAMYYDEWHPAQPAKEAMSGITHVITSFADPTIFNSGTAFTPFVTPETLRPSFDEGTKMCLAIGGWGQTAGYTAGQKTEETRATFAKNVATTLDTLGYDCVDIDWEYPGGNGEDYKQNPNSGKVDEIDNYPLLLQAIRDAIGDKELSIAVPGKEGDMIAFTAEKVPAINDIVDVVNVMSYDLMNRRDNVTNHHSSVQGSLKAVEKYIELGVDAAKINLGLAFYAKFFATIEDCTEPLGCQTDVLEDESGTDTGKSGATTFLEGVEVAGQGIADEEEGGEWYYDAATKKFWTWDTPDFISQKFEKIVKAKSLGGVMAWSLGEDSADLTYIKAIQENVKNM
ncbi:glycoside hydrolase family 18 protein [Poronia punctata]|nr:glycoside hydrolase family 18 protein [Poronia punctata]